MRSAAVFLVIATVPFAAVAQPGAPNATQSAPGSATSAPAPAPKAKTVTRVICERVDVEQDTGSRLGSAPKKCRKVEVPAPETKAERGQR